MAEKPSNRLRSNGGVDEGDGHEEQQPLRPRGGLETERPATHSHAHAAEQEASRRGSRLRRNCVRAALVLCLLTLPAGVLLLQRWRAASSPERLFEVELPKEDDDQDRAD